MVIIMVDLMQNLMQCMLVTQTIFIGVYLATTGELQKVRFKHDKVYYMWCQTSSAKPSLASTTTFSIQMFMWLVSTVLDL